MRFLAISLLALTATAAPVVERDLPTITNAISSIEKVLTTLDTAVKGLTAATVKDLETQSKAINDALQKATAAVSATQPIALTEAITVQTASQKLTTLTQNVVNGLIAKKPVIDAAKAGPTVVQQLTSQKAAAGAFIKAVTSKVPAAVQSIAATLAGQVTTALDKGIKAFS